MVKLPSFLSRNTVSKLNNKLEPIFGHKRLKEADEGKAYVSSRGTFTSLEYDDTKQNTSLSNQYYNAYHNFPIVSTSIDAKVKQVVQDFRIDGPDKTALMKWSDSINLRHHLRRICRNGLINGTYWTEMVDLDVEEKKGLGRLKNPKTFKHIDFRTMSIIRTTKGKVLCHVQDINSKNIYWGEIPPTKTGWVKGGEIDDVFCWKWNVVGDEKYGTSVIHSSLHMLNIKDQIETDLQVIAKRYLAPIVHAKVGDELHFANQEMVDSVTASLEDIYSDTEYVTNHLVSIDTVDLKNKGVDFAPILNHIDAQILLGLDTHGIVLPVDLGNAQNDKGAEIKLRANGRSIKEIQDELKMAIEEQVFKKLTGSDKNKLVWESVEERQFELDVDILTTLVKNGILTQQKANDMLPDQFHEKLPPPTMLPNPIDMRDQRVPSDEKSDDPNNPTKKTIDGKQVTKDGSPKTESTRKPSTASDAKLI
jgi:hypothetical protein